MAGKWGSKKNGVRVGFFYDSLEVNAAGTQARIKGGRIRIDRDVNISDSTNSLSLTGGAVTDDSWSNVNASGSGAKTLKSAVGTWITLSTTVKETRTAKVTFSGINYAGGTLSVSVTVTYPLAGDGGSVSPDPGTGDVYPNPWADEDAPDFATEPYVETVYGVRLPAVIGPEANVPAWDVQVDLDGGRAPYAQARFKAPVSYLTEATYAWTNPRTSPVVQISAGWRYPSTYNSHVLFSGVITERTLRVDSSGAYVEFVAESYETILDYPSNVGPVGVSNTYTSVKQFYDANSFYRKPTWTEPGWNLVPTSAQLAEYRAIGIEKDDDVGDWFRTASSTMGQWMRGHPDSVTPAIENLTDPYPYQRLVELDLSAFDSIERVENLDNWANILRLTAQWTYNTDGDTKAKRRTYPKPGITNSGEAVRARDVTLNIKPPGGNNPPSNWAPALRWRRRLDEASRGSWTGQCRALWWLQPRIDGVLIKGAPLADTGGAIQRIQFLVDQGLMQLTWNVVHA